MTILAACGAVSTFAAAAIFAAIVWDVLSVLSRGVQPIPYWWPMLEAFYVAVALAGVVGVVGLVLWKWRGPTDTGGWKRVGLLVGVDLAVLVLVCLGPPWTG